MEIQKLFKRDQLQDENVTEYYNNENLKTLVSVCNIGN